LFNDTFIVTFELRFAKMWIVPSNLNLNMFQVSFTYIDFTESIVL